MIDEAGSGPTPAVLFVCTGNTCRSPLAEALARQRVRQQRLPLRVRSAGVSAVDGAPASRGALHAGREAGIDLASHQARLLTRAMVTEAALVLVMGASHREFVRILAPEAEPRVHLLRDYATRGADRADVPDPIGGDREVYRRTLYEIRELVEQSLQRFAEDASGQRH